MNRNSKKEKTVSDILLLFKHKRNLQKTKEANLKSNIQWVTTHIKENVYTIKLGTINECKDINRIVHQRRISIKNFRLHEYTK